MMNSFSLKWFVWQFTLFLLFKTLIPQPEQEIPRNVHHELFKDMYQQPQII